MYLKQLETVVKVINYFSPSDNQVDKNSQLVRLASTCFVIGDIFILTGTTLLVISFMLGDIKI